jgi:hypothetical protein
MSNFFFGPLQLRDTEVSPYLVIFFFFLMHINAYYNAYFNDFKNIFVNFLELQVPKPTHY